MCAVSKDARALFSKTKRGIAVGLNCEIVRCKKIKGGRAAPSRERGGAGASSRESELLSSEGRQVSRKRTRASSNMEEGESLCVGAKTLQVDLNSRGFTKSGPI